MKALITGITGQTGSYLAELLLSKGYEVHGLIRRHSTPSTQRIDHIFGDVKLHYGDLLDDVALWNLIDGVRPDEIYNMAAQSHVRTSFDIPVYTANVDALGTLRILELIRGEGIKFYQASSSEMFGSAAAPQSERTPFHPRSPYGVAKVFSYWATVNYREAYNLFGCNGILFNHESPRRGDTFVTQKIVKAAVRIHRGSTEKLLLGNLHAKRDWGFAGDYVEAIYKIMQHRVPDDYVIATGESHSVIEFLEESFRFLGMDWHDYVKIDSRYFRPTEVGILLGDSTKAKTILGWEPKVKFKELVKMMLEAELAVS